MYSHSPAIVALGVSAAVGSSAGAVAFGGGAMAAALGDASVNIGATIGIGALSGGIGGTLSGLIVDQMGGVIH
eukprot:CAMPEP_0114677440 /NCGR_PEP_ID=MMETSP0191-20121206/50522_1 /TAXON_ID=126664 /ORGANISM="Sorites sp." /LENGTH=72 /DNA_ID=CAMNT_0001950009 /DNA_START=72 /DNA_END=290 /DNA_ORIENTATION=+